MLEFISCSGLFLHYIEGVDNMDKSLNGKKLPTGISQRKDGLYSARYTSKSGKRIEKYFASVQEARRWLEDAKYEDKHGTVAVIKQMTVNEWFDYWINEIKKPTVRYNTVRNYTERYMRNIKPMIGDMLLVDVKPMHCQNILNSMAEKYKGSTIEQTRIAMCSMFHYAWVNEVIMKNPVNGTVKLSKPIVKKVRFLTLDEQARFLKVADGTSNYPQFMLVLQTGLRTGEMMGLTWEDIDFEARTIKVQRTLEFRYGYQEFRIGEPKTRNSYRTIPMTQIAYDILKAKKEESETRKVADSRYKDFVFLNRKGLPTKNSAYDTTLYKLADKAGIEHFHMHTLRHIYATRCIEAGMRPKTLQELLGHSNIGITMNLYVHNSEEEKFKEIKKFEESFELEYNQNKLA